ncbi:MAG: GH3 family domain-containing protein [Pseudomonadota bacterium]
MSLISIRSGHAALSLAVAGGRRRYVRDMGDLERIQRAKLSVLLAAVAPSRSGRLQHAAYWRWEDFTRSVPVTGWNEWSLLIDEQRRQQSPLLIDSPVVRYQPTSGSTSAIKYVPYTRRFLAELDAAIAPWLGDLYTRHPAIRGGRHYWSVSWLPTALRESCRADLNDDLQLLAAGKRLLAGTTQAVPQETSLAGTSDGSLFATLAWLAADRHLGMLSVWSPTFGLGLLERLAVWREPLAAALNDGRWPRGYGDFGKLRCPRAPRAAKLLYEWDGTQDPEFFRTLWPQLALVSAWDTAAAAPWAGELQARLPHAAFQGKGLWATEGVVTIPFMDRHLLAYRSHVYEFQDADSGRVHAPWELRTGQQVIPLLSTGSGLLRYRMNDVMSVEGHVGNVPALRFLGRNDGADLVGEKISTTLAQQMLDALAARHEVRPLTLLAASDAGEGRPGYVLLAEPPAGDGAAALGERVARDLETALLAHFHYRLARDLGQLAPARAVLLPDMKPVYVDMRRAAGMIEGNIKVEALLGWRRALPAALRPSPSRAWQPA